MCATCGCGHAEDHDHDHVHPHDHDHEHHHHHHHHHHRDERRVIALERAILDENDRIAEQNRAFLRGREVLALNLVSSPGSGKTAILERTIRALDGELEIAVLEGDQATDNDAERIRAAGARATQINTGAGCHLDADMVRRALDEMDPTAGSVLMIENVGNLVCPALFDLGELAKVVVCSVTEGEDKPIKYPHMFRASRLMLLNKIDLLPHLDFDVARCVELARTVNPDLEVIELSARTGDGFDAWLDWIRAHGTPRRRPPARGPGSRRSAAPADG